jgi:hypothetical protein
VQNEVLGGGNMSDEEAKKHVLLSDEPIFETKCETTRNDDLHFTATAEVLANAALYTPNPITIGIFGQWGSGKTSLMRLMMDVVAREGQGDNAAVPVWFNAWQYEREEHLIIPLIATIAREIKKRENSWSASFQEGGKKVHDALRAVLYGISMKGKLGLPGTAEIEISASMKDMIERYEEVTQDTLMARSLYFDAFDKLRNISQDKNNKNPKIVVFIDDLDRCLPEQAVRLLESIKLILHQPGFAFVLGIYPQIIEEFILNKYIRDLSDDNGSNLRRGVYCDYFKEYLGKIVQVRHHVPKRKPCDMNDYIRALIREVDVELEFKDISEPMLFELIAEAGKRNPREIVRKLNGLIVMWRIKKREASNDEQYSLLGLLINEVTGEEEYESFCNNLGYQPKEDQKTIGEYLSKALTDPEVKSATDHEARIKKLKEKTADLKSDTMEYILDFLERDKYLCNV